MHESYIKSFLNLYLSHYFSLNISTLFVTIIQVAWRIILSVKRDYIILEATTRWYLIQRFMVGGLDWAVAGILMFSTRVSSYKLKACCSAKCGSK